MIPPEVTLVVGGSKISRTSKLTFKHCRTRKKHSATQKQISGLAHHLIFHRFLQFDCCLSIVLELD